MSVYRHSLLHGIVVQLSKLLQVVNLDGVLEEGNALIDTMYKVVKKYREIMITRTMKGDDCCWGQLMI